MITANLHYKVTKQFWYIRVYIGYSDEYILLYSYYLRNIPSDSYPEETVFLTSSKIELQEFLHTEQFIAKL